MKRIGILSDTHSCWDDRYSKHFGDCDEIWHAGDVGDISVIERLQNISPVVRAVSGNIDGAVVRRHCPEQMIFDVEGIRVFMTHIGGYPGKYNRGIESVLRSNHVRLMVCGHSHILKVMPDHSLNLLHINPGAAGYHGWQRKRTLIKLTIDNGQFKELDVVELTKKIST
ncbi:MAG: metallophosphatase family protein [Bacteroides sp.]|nr:metallophosphatase family protein [Bacteroides sp.]